MKQFDWDRGFPVDFDLNTGRSKAAETTRRYLSQMQEMFFDAEAVKEILKKEDPLIYEFYELGCPERQGDLAFGTTILYPGMVGDELYDKRSFPYPSGNIGGLLYVKRRRVYGNGKSGRQHGRNTP